MPPTVLIAENEGPRKAALETALNSLGWYTWHTAEGTKAVALSKQMRFDFILLDLGLADGNPVDIAREFRHCDDRKSLCIVGLGPARGNHNRESLMEAGINMVLDCDSTEELLSSLQRWTAVQTYRIWKQDLAFVHSAQGIEDMSKKINDHLKAKAG
jgi:DNA-binding response OmpR family regulator